MKMRHLMAAMLVVSGSAVLTGCPPATTANPPLLGPAMPRRSLIVHSTRLKVEIPPFNDRTTFLGGVSDLDTGPFYRSGAFLVAAPGKDGSNAAGAAAGTGEVRAPGMPLIASALPTTGPTLVQTLPDAIAGFLSQSGRFEVLAEQGGECDVRLAGALTGASRGSATLDLRLISCFTNSDMASVTANIRYASSEQEIQASRDDIRGAVQKLVGAIPDPKEMRKGQIVSRDGNYVTLNLGKEDKVMKGMKAFAVTYGDRVVDPRNSDMVGDEVFTGDLYIFAVFGRTSRGWIVDERGTKTRVGDYVIFK